jgi:hypothetical protein
MNGSCLINITSKASMLPLKKFEMIVELTPLELIEVQSRSYLGEDDIVRFEDLYGRT